MANTPQPIDADYTAVSVTHFNRPTELLYPKVIPTIPVNTEAFESSEFAKEQHFTLPETITGRKATPNEVEEYGKIVSSATQWHALDDFVPYTDDMNFAGGGQMGQKSPEQRAVLFLTHLLQLRREKSASNLLFTSANYATTLRATLTGTSQWSNFTVGNPLDDILTALDKPLMRPNKIIFGQAAWTKVRQHPKIVEAVKGTGASSGTASRMEVAELFEVAEICVGSGWQNTALPGQTPVMTRLWGKHCAMVYADEMASNGDVPTFAGNFQFSPLEIRKFWDPKRGVKGGNTIRISNAFLDKRIDEESGYFFQNCVA